MKKTQPTDNEVFSPLACARQTLAVMLERHIDPTPVNYTIWYHYIAKDKKDLCEEIDKLLKKKNTPISNDVAIYLYNRYVLEQSGKEGRAAETASQNAQAVLAEIMHVVDKFSGDTKNYTIEIDEQVSALSSKIKDPILKEIATEIVTRARAIRDSGETLNNKLEDSRREVASLRANLERVIADASRDFLTGTANRKVFELRIEEFSTYAREHKSDLCLLMIDIDHFKRINDNHGHLMGDEVLRRAGKILLENIKGKDVVARYGGEEFAILLPNTSLATGLIVAENIRRSFAETEMIRRDTQGSIGTITVSVGVSRYRLEEDSIPMFISRADNALYRSKTSGRNRVSQESFE